MFCLEDGCEQRLQCIECSVEDSQHKLHQHIVIKEFMNDGGKELNRIFDNIFQQCMVHSQTGSVSVKQLLDYRVDKYMDEREE